MGLAASQARFLAITARKMNCEFQSMQIAQEKLSVTRDLQKAAQNYQTALDATKLVWDCDEDVYDLSYGVMMTPSVLNDFNPYLVTDTRGRIVLSDNMFLAAVNAGIIDANGDPTGKPMMLGVDSNDKIVPYYADIAELGDNKVENDNSQNAGINDGSRNAFLYQLSQLNQIPGSTYDAILALGVDGYSRSGIGGPIFDKSRANALNTSMFIDFLSNMTYGKYQEGFSQNIFTLSKDSTASYYIYRSSDSPAGVTPPYKKYDKAISSGDPITKDMNVKMVTYKAGTTALFDFQYNLSANTTATCAGQIDSADYAAGASIPAGTLNFQKGNVLPIDVTVAFETDEPACTAQDKLFALNIVDIFKDAEGNSLLTTDSSKMRYDRCEGKFYVTRNGQSISNPDSLAGLTLGDILTGKYEICYHPKDDNYSEAKEIFLKIINQMAKKLGQGSDEFFGLYTDRESGLALDQALAFTTMLFSNVNTSIGGDLHHAGSLNDTAATVNQVIKSKSKPGDYDGMYSFSLTNMLKSLLTYYAIALDGFDCGYGVDKSSAKRSDYVTDDLDYFFIIYRENKMSTQDMLNAEFYNMLYNQIATQGACTDEILRDKVNDPAYLQQAIKNGQLFISALSDDGYFYQRPYSIIDNHIAEVADEDAIARAEVEYNVTKSKLNAKEETLELKMKNLDMEISSLTTEFDTVKNLISKNVEKVFTMFST